MEHVTFPLGGGGLGRAKVAWPSGQGVHPAVLVLHEILGPNADMDRIAQRFASEGYVALAVDFFGSGLRALCVLRAIAELRNPARSRPDGAFDILSSAERFLRDQPRVDGHRIGAVGFCMGGGFAVLHGARSDLAIVATYYGDVPADSEALRGIPPVVGGFGARDRVFGAGAERLRKHLAGLEVPSDIKVYPYTGHSYMSHSEGWVATLGALSPMRAGYDEQAAEDSWARMLAFFAEHLNLGAAES